MDNSQLKWLYSCVDFTSLNGTDTNESIKATAEQLKREYEQSGFHPAAFCTWPIYAGLVKKALEGTPIQTAVVSGGFPAGQTHFSLKMSEVAMAVAEGRSEERRVGKECRCRGAAEH